MKNLFYFIVLVGGGFGIYMYFNNKNALVNQISTQIDGASVTPGLVNTMINFIVTIINPSGGSQDINSFTADVVYNNTPIGKINYLSKLSIPPSGKVTITVPVSINNIDIATKFPELITSSFSGIKILLSGSLNTSLGVIPFDNTTTLF